MKWIGQYIQDFIARFRNDVYLEDIESGTIASGGNLGLDSNNKIVKANASSGDLTAVVAGTGLSGTDLSGPIPTLNVDASIPEITTLAGLTSFGTAGATTDIAAGDVTMYNAVNNGNPTISLGSSATNRFEIQAIYNSGAQTLDEVAFQSYTTDGGTSDGRFKYYIDEVLTFKIADTSAIVYGDFYSDNSNGFIRSSNNAASSTTGGGKLILMADDGAAMADNHRLGTIEFKGAEDASNTRSIGARIDAVCRDAWDGTNNDADLEFYTTDGTTESKVLTLDADKKAYFADILVEHGRTRIKILPSDFIADDGGRPVMIDDVNVASERLFLETHAANTAYATIDIPTGYKAEKVMIYGASTSPPAVEVWEFQIDSNTGVSKGTGNVDTEINITDVTSTATNYLFIQVLQASGDEIHGGYVTIDVA